MTVDKDLKRLVRARAARTGQSYAAARRSMLQTTATATTHDLWFARSSQGYSGKGAKATGFEHHEVSVNEHGVVVDCEVVFRNYGVQHYLVSSNGVGGTSRYEHPERGIVVEGRADGDRWHAVVRDDGAETEVTIVATGAPPVPSIAARFLPLGASYVPVPEDGFPAWRPPGRGSWFPVMGAARESLVVPRRVIANADDPARLDHVTGDGVVRASAWIDDGGRVVRYEQAGCMLRAVTPDQASKLDPRP